jgi:hypothetical protein
VFTLCEKTNSTLVSTRNCEAPLLVHRVSVRAHMASFSVRCIFRWKPRRGQVRKHLYEERITLWKARDIDEAIAFAEAEAQTYASDSGVEYLGLCQAYALVEEPEATAIEVSSLLRDSDLEPTRYLDAFFATGGEHERVA